MFSPPAWSLLVSFRLSEAILSFLHSPHHSSSFSICIIICLPLKRNLTLTFYGSTNSNNQCFIVPWIKENLQLSLSFSAHPSHDFILLLVCVYPSMQPSIQPIIHLFTQPTYQPTNHPSTHPTNQWPIHPTIHLSIHPSIYPTNQSTIHPSIQLIFIFTVTNIQFWSDSLGVPLMPIAHTPFWHTPCRRLPAAPQQCCCCFGGFGSV